MTLNLESLNQAHVETTEATWTGRGWCNGCMQRWPCTTRQLLDLVETVEARAEGLRAAQKHIRDLQAQLEQLRAALEEIALGDHLSDWARDKACAALKETKL